MPFLLPCHASALLKRSQKYDVYLNIH